jgi:tRNA1(Val) A37 N6-methylase TrmN6
MCDFFTGSGGLLDYAKQESKSNKSSFDIVITNPPYLEDNRCDIKE